jgi:hypothetical protein
MAGDNAPGRFNDLNFDAIIGAHGDERGASRWIYPFQSLNYAKNRAKGLQQTYDTARQELIEITREIQFFRNSGTPANG